MGTDKIMNAALARFARQGYDGASLSEIAADAGIRKPSIYAHFKSKDHLFMALLEEALKREKGCLWELAASGDDARRILMQYLFQMPERYALDKHLQFWLRTIYLAPQNLETEIRKLDSEYADLLDEAISGILNRHSMAANGNRLPSGMLRDAYTGILRGVHAELLYNGAEKAKAKAEAMWEVFLLALSA